MNPIRPVKLKYSDVPNTGAPIAEICKTIPGYKYPAVWFPHTLMGISTADMVEDTTAGAFGPFTGQYFVADQGHSKVMRMFMEKVNGEYQGACFPFREGWESGLLRLRWGLDGSLFGGMTSRGWSSTGKDNYGVQRLVWTGKMPFEMRAIRATPDGFEIEFTKPVDRATALDTANYSLSGFTYKYHSTYGSPIINNQPCPIRGIVLSDDGLKARLVVDGLRDHYIHEVRAEGVKAASGENLLHPFGYYTLNAIPSGEKLVLTASTNPHAGHSMGNGGSMKAPVATSGKPSLKAPVASVRKTAKRVNEQPASWTSGPDQTVSIGTKPGLKFDTEKVEVKAGAKVKWTFNNNDDMTHNCVLVAPGMADAVGMQAIKLGLKGSQLEYVPNSPNVLFHTGLLQPESSETIYFTAPTQPGEYTFVCTYPGHYTLMQGKLRVVK